ncbi:hypothetical protein BX616_003844 [Lobosporangium transversale]|nr:hypothetical protein BX616_003844 [Lobosporangium transversale]
MSVSLSNNSVERTESQNPSSLPARRRSTSHKSPEVVTADEIRPDWNRRILVASQRQPGSRRASTSSSVSNATFALGRRLAGQRNGSNSRRSNSSAAAADYSGYLTAMRNMGADLEELMIMEAMRQSLQDEHDRQAREAAAASSSNGSTPSSSPNGSNTTDPSRRPQGRDTLRSGSSRRSQSGAVMTSSPLSSPPAPPSTISSSSTVARPRASSLTSGPSDEDQDAESETDSDQDTPGLLHNRAIRFATVTPIPASSLETGGGMPKHRPQEESATATSSAGAV